MSEYIQNILINYKVDIEFLYRSSIAEIFQYVPPQIYINTVINFLYNHLNDEINHNELIETNLGSIIVEDMLNYLYNSQSKGISVDELSDQLLPMQDILEYYSDYIYNNTYYKIRHYFNIDFDDMVMKIECWYGDNISIYPFNIYQYPINLVKMLYIAQLHVKPFYIR